jgi:uncharacterized membrane protein
MQARPKIKIELSKFDKVVETLCITILIGLWVGTIAFFSKPPDQIPTHFNAAGQPDDFGSKTGIFLLPAIATIIYTGMTILNKRPHIYNYLQPVTIENAQRLYTSATRLIRILKLAVVVIFSGIVVMTYRTSLTESKGLGKWFLPFVLLLMVAPIIFYLIKSLKSKP